MEESIGLELRALNNLIRRYFDYSSHKKEIEQITGNNGWIIGYLSARRNQDVFQKDLEEHFTITRSTTSKVLSLMEKKGLIQRLSVPEDGRLKKIVLTPKALELSDMMKKDGEQMEALLIKGFHPAELDQLHLYLQRMKDNIASAPQKNETRRFP